MSDSQTFVKNFSKVLEQKKSFSNKQSSKGQRTFEKRYGKREMMKMWGLILVFYTQVGGETSNLVCTSSIDIKNCIYKNQENGFNIKLTKI